MAMTFPGELPLEEPGGELFACFHRDVSGNLWVCLAANAAGYKTLSRLFEWFSTQAELASGDDPGEEYLLHIDQNNLLNELSDAGLMVFCPPQGLLKAEWMLGLSLTVEAQFALYALHIRGAMQVGALTRDVRRMIKSTTTETPGIDVCEQINDLESKHLVLLVETASKRTREVQLTELGKRLAALVARGM